MAVTSNAPTSINKRICALLPPQPNLSTLEKETLEDSLGEATDIEYGATAMKHEFSAIEIFDVSGDRGGFGERRPGEFGLATWK